MLLFGYNPENYGGKVWWNEKNPTMREIWGTQEDYDNFKQNGGTWAEYAKMCRERFEKRHTQPAKNNSELFENESDKRMGR